jgi:hypothetical protein
MAKKSKATFQKMEKEKARQQKQREKEARRVEAKAHKVDSEPRTNDEDPDIAGIRPGPQPLPEQWDYVRRR